MKNLPVIVCSAAVLIVAVVAAAWSVPDSDTPSLSTLAEETSEGGSDVPAGGSAPYRSSVVGTDFDFITENDPSAFDRLEFLGLQEFEMPDKRDNDEPLVQKAYVFEAHFTDGRKIKIALDQEFGSKEAAERDAARYGPRLGKLPPLYRKIIKHITVNFGGTDTTAFAEDKGHFFTIYSGNASKRIGTHDLEETFFHEGTHASIQEAYLEFRNGKAPYRVMGLILQTMPRRVSRKTSPSQLFFLHDHLSSGTVPGQRTREDKKDDFESDRVLPARLFRRS